MQTLFALVISAMIVSCGQIPGEMASQPAIKVDFLAIHPSNASLVQKYPATLEGSVNVDIKAQVTGYLETIYVKEGDYVNKGQVLFKIQGDNLQEQVNNARASLKSARAAQETAKIEVDKIVPLVEGKVVSSLQLETAIAQYEASKAQVAQAKATLAASEVNAAFGIIKAPVSGYIGRIPNRTGNLVTPTDTSPLTSLSDIKNIYAYFSMSEADFISYTKNRKTGRTGMEVEMVMADGTVYENKGKLESASGNIDRATGTMVLKAVFTNPDKLLRSGGSARIIITRNISSTLKVPMAGVKDIQNKLFVFVLGDSNKVEMKAIEVAGQSGNNYIVKSGLRQGDRIAVNSIDNLNNGMKVSPTLSKEDLSRK